MTMDNPNELARVTAIANAPASAIWAVLADFERPQRLAPSITGCTMTGSGVGAVRIVESSRGLSIHERLLICDAWQFRFQYEVLDTGDMPFANVTSYRATIKLDPLDDGRTAIDWLAEGSVSGDAAPVRDYLETLYRGAIANLETLAMAETQP